MATWWLEQAEPTVDLRSSRRVVAIVRTLGPLARLPEAVVQGAALAAALPPDAVRTGAVPVPVAACAALTQRHAHWDGTGFPAIGGSAIHPAAQLLAAAEWIEHRRGGSPRVLEVALRTEAGRALSPALAFVAADHLREILAAAPADAHHGLRVSQGALLCIRPAGVEELHPASQGPVLEHVERVARSALRPFDRVYVSGLEVVTWIAHGHAAAAASVARRLAPALDAVPVVGGVGTLRCAVGVALAGDDATTFADLLAVARRRALQASEQAPGLGAAAV